MTKRPHGTPPHKGAAPENAAVEDVRTKKELDAAETKRQADAEFEAARRARADIPTTGKSHPKLHRNEDEGPIQDTSGEPAVEDEP